MSKPLLEPCPFCGGPAHFVLQGGYHVMCARCSAKSRNLNDQQRLADEWNRRAVLQTRTAEVTPDVASLVIAAREFWDEHNDFSAESKALDKALEPFAARVAYANEPDEVAP